MGRRQRRRVVQAVPDHQRPVSVTAQGVECCDLFGRCRAVPHIRDPEGARDADRAVRDVARQHGDGDA